MFTICYEESWVRANKIYQNVFGEDKKMPSGIYSLLVCQDTPVGVAVAKLTKDMQVEIKTVGNYQQIRGQGLGDFFMRSLFNVYTQGGNGIYVNWVHPYFDKFGFKPTEDGRLYVSAEDLVFPHKCKH